MMVTQARSKALAELATIANIQQTSNQIRAEKKKYDGLTLDKERETNHGKKGKIVISHYPQAWERNAS